MLWIGWLRLLKNDGVIAEYEYAAMTTKYKYNQLGQLTQLTTGDVNSKIQDFTYQYDVIGNIVEEVRI